MHRFDHGDFLGAKEYLPTIYDSLFVKCKPSNGVEEVLEIELFEAHSREEYDRLRPLSYTMTDLVLICYPCAVPRSGRLHAFEIRDDILQKTEEIVRCCTFQYFLQRLDAPRPAPSSFRSGCITRAVRLRC